MDKLKQLAQLLKAQTKAQAQYQKGYEAQYKRAAQIKKDMDKKKDE